MDIRAEKSEFAELRNKVAGKRSFAAVLFDDGDDFVFDELARCPAHQLFFVVKLRVKVDEVDAAVSGHACSSFDAARWFVCVRARLRDASGSVAALALPL